MKLKHVLASLMLCLLLLFSAATIAQNTNTFPPNGPVGIGTTSPSGQLHVVGSSRFDGNAYLTGSIDIYGGDLRIWNQSASGSPVRLLGIEQDGKIVPIDSGTVNMHYLLVDSAIKVGDSSINILGSTNTFQNNHIFATSAPLIINGYQSVTPQNLIMNSYGGNVSIGYLPTNLPTTAKFSVNGDCYFNQIVGINTEPAQGTALKIKGSSGQTGLVVEHAQTSANGWGIRSVVKHPLTKAFSVTYNDINSSFDPETFMVLGNGITNISGLAGTYQTTSQLYVESDLNIGSWVKMTNNAANKTAILAEVLRNDTKALSVYNNAANNTGERFQVKGDGTTQIGLNISNSNQAQLKVESTQAVCAHFKNNNNWSYAGNTNTAILADVVHDDAKAISVVRSLPGQPAAETFKVTGKGVAWMQEIRVRVAPFPDYVFEKDYNLMDLDSLEKFVEANHHLPGMPTAAEVEENDANLGELVRLQQEKIEELTLYLIQIKKELSAQAKN